VLYTFKRLEIETTDEVLTREQFRQVYQQAANAIRRHLENMKRTQHGKK
jgi:predicted RNA-binding protein associated with RNAse of E/G family